MFRGDGVGPDVVALPVSDKVSMFRDDQVWGRVATSAGVGSPVGHTLRVGDARAAEHHSDQGSQYCLAQPLARRVLPAQRLFVLFGHD